jgi:peptide/nickel transport system permease protein
MLKVMVRRVGISVVLIVVIPAITFFMEGLIPGSAATAILPLNATPTVRHNLIQQLGLNRPVWDQYFSWFDKFLHGNLGTSFYTGQTVVKDLNARLGVSLSLIIGATLLLSVVGVTVGVMSARFEGKFGRVVDVISISGLAIPNFWLAVILIEVFAVQLRWFPAIGYSSPSSPGSWLRSLVLPVVALGFAGITVVAKQTRDQMKDMLQKNYIRSMRANGLSNSSIVYRHALRNAAIPVVTVIGLVFVSALSGSVIVENIFALPGLGSAAVQATTGHDVPVLQGVSVYFTLIVVAVNFIVDLTYIGLNPRTRKS